MHSTRQFIKFLKFIKFIKKFIFKNLTNLTNLINHLVLRTSSHCLLVIGFSIYFTPLIGVLFAFPSRYSFTIGQCACLVLDRDRPRFPQGLPCLVVLRCTLSGISVSDTGRSPFIVSCSKLFSYQNTHQISRVLQPPLLAE